MSPIAPSPSPSHAPRRRSLLLAMLLQPLAASPIAALWLHSSHSVIKQGWILAPGD